MAVDLQEYFRSGLQSAQAAATYTPQTEALKSQYQLQDLVNQSAIEDAKKAPIYEKEAQETLANLVKDPANQGKPISDLQSIAGQKLLASGNMKTGLKLLDASTLSADRESRAMESQFKLASQKLDMAEGQLEVANTPEEVMGVISSIKDPQTLQRVQPIVQMLQQGRPVSEVKTALSNGILRPLKDQLAIKKAQAESLKAETDKKKEEEKALHDRRVEAAGQLNAFANLTGKLGEMPPELQSAIRKSISSLSKDLDTMGGADTTAPVTPTSTTTEATTDKTQPLSVRQNNPLNLTDSSGKIKSYKSPEEGRAAGMADLAGKLEGTSKAYKARFGNAPVTPATLAETWAPAKAKGNTPEATSNYSKTIATALGIKTTDKIENTPENRDKVFNAMAGFEAGGSGRERLGLPTEGLVDVPKKSEVPGLTPVDTPWKVAQKGGKKYDAMISTMQIDVGTGFRRIDDLMAMAKPGEIPSGSPLFGSLVKGDGLMDAFKKTAAKGDLPANLSKSDAILYGLAFDVASARSGGRGQLSDSKIAEVRQMMPLNTDPQEVRAYKIGLITNALEEANSTLPSDKQVDINKYKKSNWKAEDFLQKGGAAAQVDTKNKWLTSDKQVDKTKD